MGFEGTYFPKDFEAVRDIKENNEISEINRFELDIDFVEQYEDLEGILHIKTSFRYDDIDEEDLWEVFSREDGSKLLEALLHDNI